MGCDIHYVIEKKFDDKWIGVYAKYETPDALPGIQRKDDGVLGHIHDRQMVFSDRDYSFFNLLAGVRGEGPAEPLGIPDNFSELVQAMLDIDIDAHSHSFLPYREWCERYALATARVFTDEGNHEWLSGLHDSEMDEYRVVFWFDN